MLRNNDIIFVFAISGPVYQVCLKFLTLNNYLKLKTLTNTTNFILLEIHTP